MVKPVTAQRFFVITTGGAFPVSETMLEEVRAQFDSDRPEPLLTFEALEPPRTIELLHTAFVGFAVTSENDAQSPSA